MATRAKDGEGVQVQQGELGLQINIFLLFLLNHIHVLNSQKGK